MHNYLCILTISLPTVNKNNLIPEVLKYHHVPLHIQTIIGNLYSNFHTSIITKSFKTPFLKVGRGVLQGDCLSPLTFNLCFNTFIRYISDPKFTQFGFSTSSLNPLHWFQFADDATVITSLENENQLLLNHFSRWCNWADMTIRVDKCSSFGIKKSSTSSVQILPKLIINHDLVPTVNIGSSFKYLGRYFSFSMDNVEHRSILLATINIYYAQLIKSLAILKINYCYTTAMFSLKFPGTSL